MRGAETRVRRLAANALNNAPEASSECGSVAVEAHNVAVYLQVDDADACMDGSMQEQAFNPSFTSKLRGNGLSLAIFQAIVHAHGAEIAIDSAMEKRPRVPIYLPAAARSGEAPA